MEEAFRIRPARVADAPQLAELERLCFSDPWSEGAFREALESAWTFGLVAERNGATRGGVAGYLIGRDAAGTGEILNLAVAPEVRRRGVARRLLERGLAQFAVRRSEEVFLEVRESNRAARELYSAAGFRPVGMRSGYYRNPAEDALVLRLALASLA